MGSDPSSRIRSDPDPSHRKCARIRPDQGQHTWIPAQIPACKQSENTVKNTVQNTVDDGVGYVYYDHDMSSMGTACTVTGAVTGAVIGAVLIGAVLRSAMIGAP